MRRLFPKIVKDNEFEDRLVRSFFIHVRGICEQEDMRTNNKSAIS